MITEETTVAVATIHCEPDCSQCKEADAIGDAPVTTAPDIITEETRMASATGVAATDPSSNGSRPQTMGPIGLSAPWSQTWNQPWNRVNQVGNYQAAWTPLSRDCNNQWGNGMMPYNLVARGLSPILPSQFEKELMALVKRVLI